LLTVAAYHSDQLLNLDEQFCLGLCPTIPGQKVLFIRVEYAPWSSHCVFEILSFLTTNIDGVAASALAIFAASGLQLGSALLQWHLAEAGLFKRAKSFHALTTAAIFYFEVTCWYLQVLSW
jgi:hypothetical protein